MKREFYCTMRYVLVGIGLLAIGVGGWLFFKQPFSGIRDFNFARDAQALVERIEIDKYWLSAEPDLDEQFILKTHSPNKDPRYFGKLFIKVLYDEDVFAGFVTYYQKRFNEGWVQFLSVNKQFRGKGYGKKLLSYAVEQLFDMGCTRVGLVTRISNTWAQRIYDALHFKDMWRDDEYVTYAVNKTAYYAG